MRTTQVNFQLIATLTLFSFCTLLAPAVLGDDLSMTTYYPAPSGNYQNVAVTTLVTTLNATVTGTLTALNANVGTLIATTFNPANLNATGDVNVGGILTVTGDTSLASLTVAGTSRLLGDTTIGKSGDAASGHFTAFNKATVNGLLDLYAGYGDPLALTAAGNSSFTGNMAVSGTTTLTGLLIANGAIKTTDLTVTGGMTLNDLTVSSYARVGNSLAYNIAGSNVAFIPGSGAGTVALGLNGNIATNTTNWINAIGRSNQGMNFSDTRVGLNVAASTVTSGPTFKIVYPTNLVGTWSEKRQAKLLEVGLSSDFSNAIDSTVRVNGTLSVADKSSFGKDVTVYSGITIGDAAAAGMTCTAATYGTLSYSCQAVSPIRCDLKICAPCNNAGSCSGQGNGPQWVTVLSTQANAGNSGGLPPSPPDW